MNIQFEKNKLYAYLGEDLVNALKKHKAFIAGGTITSLFCNREINDIDVYFRNEEAAINFVSEIWDDQKWVVSHTKKATQILYDDVNVQIIHFQYFNTAEDIFNTFDFTVCMGCFDFSTEEFVLHPDFLKHNSQRILKFNSETAFPIVSLLRVQKYEDKGYTISKPEFIRIILTCMNLEINTYEDLKEQLGGMYGINYDKLFEDVKDKEFDLHEAINKIANITLSEDYFTKPDPVEFNELEDILDTIAKKPVKVLEIRGKLYKIGYDGLLRKIDKKPECYTDVNPEDFFKQNKLYKYVKKVNDKYFSFYDDKFEYIVGKVVEANYDKKLYRGDNHAGKLHLSEKYDLETTYKEKSNAVLIEVEITPEDFIDLEFGHITAKRCKTLREVPKEEYKKWGNEKYQEDCYIT